MSDAELVRQTLAGRSEAYEELVRRWAGRVTALCHAKIGCASGADDLAQEAPLRAYRPCTRSPNRTSSVPGCAASPSATCLDWLKSKERSVISFSALRP